MSFLACGEAAWYVNNADRDVCVGADVQSCVPRYFADIKAEVDPSKTFRFYLMSGEISFHPLAVVAAVDVERGYIEFCTRHKLRAETWDKTMVKDAFAHVQMKKP